ncbi:MAG TPA: Panacea domain-containing protein [Burkholderiales bacterium]|nr:Panacea domain-containing protein [Burkholderiales bacterium]
MKQTMLDSEKALNVLLYLAISLPERRNAYKVLKAIYRANKTHLARYGREIFRETYQALKFGAVPAMSYDIVKHAKTGEPKIRMPDGVRKKIVVSEDDTIKALVSPNLRALSESDLECLNEAIEFYRGMTFDEVKDNAHEDAAYKETPRDTFIPLERIILTLPDGELLLKHLKAA